MTKNRISELFALAKPRGGEGGNVSKFNCWMRASALFLLWVTAVVALPAQTLKSLYSFDASDGRYP
jgi:hypothetical protein